MALSRITAIVLCGLIASTGCRKTAEPVSAYRTVEFHIRNEDPTGLYVFELHDDHAASMEEDLQIDIVGHVCQIDKAFLKQSVQSFHHAGRRIGSGIDGTGRELTPLRVWTLKRTANTICYYIGTQDQYTALDRTRPYQVGPHLVTFTA